MKTKLVFSKARRPKNARIVVKKVADRDARVAVYYDVVKRPDFWDQDFAYLAGIPHYIP